MTALAPHLSIYLREHLPRERAVSPHTVKTYANCFVLLVGRPISRSRISAPT